MPVRNVFEWVGRSSEGCFSDACHISESFHVGSEHGEKRALGIWFAAGRFVHNLLSADWVRFEKAVRILEFCPQVLFFVSYDSVSGWRLLNGCLLVFVWRHRKMGGMVG